MKVLTLKPGDKVLYRTLEKELKEALVLKILPENKLDILVFCDSYMKGKAKYINDVPYGKNAGQWQHCKASECQSIRAMIL